MEVIPDDLVDFQGRLPGDELRTSHLGLVRVFVDLCCALEPGLVFPATAEATAARRDWRFLLGWIRTAHDRWVNSLGAISSAGEKNAPIGAPRKHFDALLGIAQRYWVQPGGAPIRDLPKIKDVDLRRSAVRDLASLRVAQKIEQAKMVLVLSGSVIEAALLDVLLHDVANAKAARDTVFKADPKWKRPGDDLSFWTFKQIIDVCGPSGLGLLGDSTVKAAHAARDYRNYVHPYVEKQQGGVLRLADANMAAALVDLVLADLNY